MKRKVIFAMMLLAGSVSVWGQTVDTIHWYERQSDFYYYGPNGTSWIDSDLMALPNAPIYFVEAFNPSHYYLGESAFNGRAAVTPYPMKIIGVAAPIYIWDIGAMDTSFRFPEYFMVCQQEGDSFYFVGKTRWDTITPQRKFEIQPGFDYEWCYYNNYYFDLYEAYFEKPIIVHDTFYVGGTTQNNRYGSLLINNGDEIAYSFGLYTYMTHYPTVEVRGDECWVGSRYGTYAYPGLIMKKYLWPCAFYPYYDLNYISNNLQPGWVYDTTVFYVDSMPWEYLPFFPIFDTNYYHGIGEYNDTCLAPTGLHVEGMDETGVALSWDAGSDSLWQLSVAPLGAATDSGLMQMVPINYALIDSLEIEQWYVAKVRTFCDTDVFGPWTDTVMFKIPKHFDPCMVPTWLHVTALDSASVTLAWNTAEVFTWEIQLNPVELGMMGAQTLTATTNSLHVEGLSPFKWYWARMRALCDTDWYSDWTDTIRFYVPNQHPAGPDTNVTAINLVEQYTYLMPNPAREEVTVMSSFRIKSVELYGSDGKLLQTKEVNAIGTRRSLEGLPAGVYFVRVRTSAGVTTKRLVVE